MKTNVYEIITERIISLLNEGVCPWRRPWNTMPFPPRNFASGRRYNGINYFLLSSIGYEVPFFLTFKQVMERGGSVKKGSKGLPVIYWSTFDSNEPETEERIKQVSFLRYYTVFNANQIDGITFPTVSSRSGEAFQSIEKAEATVSGWSDGPLIETGYRQACYIPSFDVIRLPSPNSFDNPAAYYSTLFHEMGHATGAKRRLDRNILDRFGSANYSREELIAEITSAFLCAHCGIDNSTINRQAAYLAGWLKALKGDPRMVVTAAAQAQKAANLILNMAPSNEPPAIDAISI